MIILDHRFSVFTPFLQLPSFSAIFFIQSLLRYLWPLRFTPCLNISVVHDSECYKNVLAGISQLSTVSLESVRTRHYRSSCSNTFSRLICFLSCVVYAHSVFQYSKNLTFKLCGIVKLNSNNAWDVVPVEPVLLVRDYKRSWQRSILTCLWVSSTDPKSYWSVWDPLLGQSSGKQLLMLCCDSS